MRYAFYLILLVSVFIYNEAYAVMVGNTKVNIVKRAGKGKTFIHLHENEVTALATAKKYVARYGGTLIYLRHSGKRNIVFYLKKVRYEFDPNRIFTDTGIRKTLKQFGNYSPAAHAEVKKFANRIKNLLPGSKIIAIHNNKDYSIREYFPNKAMARDVKALHYRPNSNYRNFYFVTRQNEYKRLKKLNFNVALQARRATDDGSLSYYLAKQNYINIEAGYGQFNEQLKMIRWA